MHIADILKKIDAIEGWVVETRRELHQHPELGMEEFRTSQKISDILHDIQIPHRKGVATTGIVAVIEGHAPGKTVALRADMDALPLQEETGVTYASQNDGKMHACGHDAHMAILLGAAKVINDMKSSLPGTIKLFFQPAEETVGGAKPMIEAGCMEKPHVDYVLGLHVTPIVEAGMVLLKQGKITASSDSIKITVRGKSAHAAYPEEGIDAIVLSAHIITALQTVVSRNISPLESGVITIGKIEGGTKENIIPDSVTLSGTMRVLTPEIRAMFKKRITSLVTGICQSMGGSCTIDFEEGYPPTINNDEIVKVIESNACNLFGPKNVINKDHPSLGVEDFAYFCQYSPGAFYYLGCANREQGIDFPGHSSRFQIDERCLKIGVLLQVVNTLSLLGIKLEF